MGISLAKSIMGLVTMSLVFSVIAYAGGRVGNPVEVGDVMWGRDFYGALAASASSGKPVLVLFQEVPG